MFVKKRQRDSNEDSNVVTKWTHEHEQWACELDFDEQQGIFYEYSCHVNWIFLACIQK
jgi:hypothetical protein